MTETTDTNTLNLQIPSPTFGGSTGGWLRAAETEEKYALTWTSKKRANF
jgi:photosystem I subunit 2